MRLMFRGRHLLMALWALATSALVWAQAPVVIDDPHFQQRLTQQLDYYVDPSGQQTLAEVRTLAAQGKFSRWTQDSVQFGYNSTAYWLRVPLLNQQDSGQAIDRLYLAVRYPLLDQVQVFAVRPDRVDSLLLGDLKPYYQRPFWLKDLLFPLGLAPQEQLELFVRIQSRSSLSVPLYLYGEAGFIEHQSQLSLSDGLYFGVALALTLYNLMLFALVRRREYAAYVVFVIAHLASNSAMMGYSFALWPQALAFQQIAVYLLTLVSLMAVTYFGMVFLRTQRQQPRLHRLIQLYQLLCGLLLFSVVWLEPATSARLNVVLMLLGVLLLGAAGLRSRLQGYQPATYYLLGQSGVFLSVSFTALSSQNLLPYYHLSPDILKWGAIFEMLMFSGALAGLLNEERRLREQAQSDSFNLQLKLNAELDLKVQQRTRALAEANLKLQLMSCTDELTQLHNRRHFNQVFQAEFQRACRQNQPLALLLLDIDHFKQLNDRYGHPFGDLCLTQAARALQQNLHRATDVVARYGGEEFVVLLPNTQFDGALSIAERILGSFRELLIDDGEQQSGMTVSIGLIWAVPQPGMVQESLLKQADTLLYRAKSEGRNRVASQQLTPD